LRRSLKPTIRPKRFYTAKTQTGHKGIELPQRSGLLAQHRQHLNEVCAKVLFQIARPSQYNAFPEAGRLRHAVREMQL